MNNKKEETLVTWLNDAYAMEQGIVESLERQIGQLDDMPDAQKKIKQHLEVTKNQAERVKDCVEQLGGKISHTKSAIANVAGTMQGMWAAAAADKPLKHALSNYAIEHFEIASYKSIASAARELGHEDIAKTCEGIVREEEQMALWIEQQLPTVTGKILSTAA